MLGQCGKLTHIIWTDNEELRLKIEDSKMKTKEWRQKNEDRKMKTEEWRMKTENKRYDTESIVQI